MFLVRVVASLRDPASIPALTGAPGISSTVTDAFVDFGAAGVPALIRVVETTERRSRVTGGLQTLAKIIRRERTDIPGELRVRLGQVVADRFADPGDLGSGLIWVIDLAAALEDPALIATARALVSDPDELRARGFDDLRTIDFIQRLGRDMLTRAGIQP